jgi:hypothetical protein
MVDLVLQAFGRCKHLVELTQSQPLEKDMAYVQSVRRGGQ